MRLPFVACILNGDVDYQAGNYIYHCTEGDFLLIPPHVPHRNKPQINKNGEVVYPDILAFSTWDNHRQCCVRRGIGRNYLFPDHGTVQLLDLFIDDMLARRSRYELISHSIFLAFINLLCRELEERHYFRSGVALLAMPTAEPQIDPIQRVQREGIVRASQLSRTHRERLLEAGFLQEAVKGWLLVTNPAAPDRSSTGWYVSFWRFVAQYLGQRFGDGYCLAPEASLQRHVESTVIPAQVIVITRSGSNQTISLPFATSLLIYKDTKNFPASRVQKDGLWITDLPLALCRVQPNFFRTAATDVSLALRMVRDPSALLRHLLEGGNSTIAGRLAGAYAALGSQELADRIVETMKAAGYEVRPANPFTVAPSGGTMRVASPAAARVRSLFFIEVLWL